MCDTEIQYISVLICVIIHCYYCSLRQSKSSFPSLAKIWDMQQYMVQKPADKLGEFHLVEESWEGMFLFSS